MPIALLIKGLLQAYCVSSAGPLQVHCRSIVLYRCPVCSSSRLIVSCARALLSSLKSSLSIGIVNSPRTGRSRGTLNHFMLLKLVYPLERWTVWILSWHNLYLAVHEITLSQIQQVSRLIVINKFYGKEKQKWRRWLNLGTIDTRPRSVKRNCVVWRALPSRQHDLCIFMVILSWHMSAFLRKSSSKTVSSFCFNLGWWWCPGSCWSTRSART